MAARGLPPEDGETEEIENVLKISFHSEMWPFNPGIRNNAINQVMPRKYKPKRQKIAEYVELQQWNRFELDI